MAGDYPTSIRIGSHRLAHNFERNIMCCIILRILSQPVLGQQINPDLALVLRSYWVHGVRQFYRLLRFCYPKQYLDMADRMGIPNFQSVSSLGCSRGYFRGSAALYWIHRLRPPGQFCRVPGGFRKPLLVSRIKTRMMNLD